MSVKVSVVVEMENHMDILYTGPDEDDDDVFLEYSSGTGTTMSQFGMKQLREPPQQRRSSLFEIPSHYHPPPCGSSIMSFAIEPHLDEEGQPKQKKVQYENTYRMEPPQKFKPEKVQAVIKEVLESHLTDKTYDPLSCSLLCKSLAQDIKMQVKELNFKRYKIVAMVTIGEKKDHDVRVGSRCVWDTQWDTFAVSTFQNPHLYAVGTVYGLYYE